MEVLEQIRVAQNKRKEVQLQADRLAAEQSQYLRAHTPRPEWTDTADDFLPTMRIEAMTDSDDDDENVDSELAAIHGKNKPKARKASNDRELHEDYEEWMKAGDMDDDGASRRLF